MKFKKIKETIAKYTQKHSSRDDEYLVMYKDKETKKWRICPIFFRTKEDAFEIMKDLNTVADHVRILKTQFYAETLSVRGGGESLFNSNPEFELMEDCK